MNTVFKKWAVVLLSMGIAGVSPMIALADGGKPTPTVAPTTTEDNDDAIGEEDSSDEDADEEKEEEVVFDFDGEDVDGDEVFNIKTEEAGSVLLNVGDVCSFVDSIKIKTTDGIDGVVTLKSVEENPTDAELEKSFGYCMVEVEGIDADMVDEVEWTLGADRQELLDLEYNKDSMNLVKFSDGDWDKIKTKKVTGDTENYVYTVETDELETGTYGFAEVKSDLFTLQNILLCLGGIVGLIVLGLIVAYSMQNSDKDKSKKK